MTGMKHMTEDGDECCKGRVQKGKLLEDLDQNHGSDGEVEKKKKLEEVKHIGRFPGEDLTLTVIRTIGGKEEVKVGRLLLAGTVG